jgi:hypothetical protein
MSEMDPILPPSLNAALTQFYDAPQPDAAFAARLEASLRQRQVEIQGGRTKTALSLDDLSASVGARGNCQKQSPSRFPRAPTKVSFLQTLRARPLLALLVAMLALLILTGMVFALGRLTGFIPGFGFTSNSAAVYLLAETVESSQGGVTLRLERAVSDGARFWAAFSVKGLSGEETGAGAFVLLPDGQKLQFETGESGGQGEAQLNYTFPALPPGTQDLVLRIENLGGQNFDLGVKLRPARPGEIIPAQPVESTPAQSSSQGGIRLVLDNAATTSDKTIFQVSIHFDRPHTWLAGQWNIRLSDPAGVFYPLKDVTPATMSSDNTRIYETSPFTGAERLTLSLVAFPDADALPLLEDFSGEESVGFSFDPGSSPQAGQTWELDETLQVGAFRLHVVRATLTAEPGLLFEFEPARDVTAVMLFTSDPLLRGSSGGVPAAPGKNFSAEMIFSKLPSRPFQVKVSQVYYNARGTWQLPWQPLAAPTAEAGRPTPSAAPTLVSMATPTLTTSDPIVLEIQQLAQKFDATLRQGARWVHVVTETNTRPRAGQTFPPAYIRNEQWIEVDAEGYVNRSVWLDYDKDGTLIQQAATVGDYSVNFTLGNSGFNSGMRYLISMDTLSHELNRANPSTARVSREEVDCENARPCLLITSLETFGAPIKNPGETQSFYGAGRRVWIDRQTGEQVKFQSFWRLEDGSELIGSTQTIVQIEKMDNPPQAILELLKRVKAP